MFASAQPETLRSESTNIDLRSSSSLTLFPSSGGANSNTQRRVKTYNSRHIVLVLPETSTLTHSCRKHKTPFQDCDYFQDSYHFLQPPWKGEQLPPHCLPTPWSAGRGRAALIAHTWAQHSALSPLEHGQGRALPSCPLRGSPSNSLQKRLGHHLASC